MKHLTFAEKSLLVGDEAADVLLEYAVLLADRGRADSVRLNAYGADGDEVVATFLLDAGTPLMAETSQTSMNEPDNSLAIAYIRARIEEFRSPPHALPAEQSEPIPEFD